tara:strand:+ start:214 stop:624 length:411 start_codon:yes stop_codon:yes gene_type:complete
MNKQLLKNSYHDKKHKWYSKRRHDDYILFLKNWNELSSEDKDNFTLRELHGYNFLSVSVVNSLLRIDVVNLKQMRKIFFNNDNSFFKSFEGLGKTGVLQLNIFMYEFFYDEYKKSNKEIRLKAKKTTKDIVYIGDT